MNNVSPLRYPGGKTRACEKLDQLFNNYFNIKNINTIISPFIGGSSFEFYLQNKYNYTIIANDKFTPLYHFWLTCKNNNSKLSNLLESYDNISKEQFHQFRKDILTEKDVIVQSSYYFIINRCSFSGATLSGGFSLEASKKRFTQSSINKIKNLNLSKFTISNLDFYDFIISQDFNNTLLFLDPPYYLSKGNKLYGKDGDLHENFDHLKLYNLIKDKKGWLLTYNNCGYIRNLYKDFIIIEENWSYGMNKTKLSSEIVIVSPVSL